MRVWLAHHLDATRRALRKLAAAPINTLLFLLAIGVALALPAVGQMLLANASHLTDSTPSAPQISVFMTHGAETRAVAEVEGRLRKHAGVKQLRFLPKDETLTRLKKNPDLRDVINALPGNPFPDAFIVTPGDGSHAAMEGLAIEFRQWPKVEHVQLDSDWVRRLDALLKLGRTAVMLLAALLGCGLVAISFSIIRMQILTHRAEIEVSQLLGATEGYIRRPFLYYGVLLGSGGGFVAWLLVGAVALWLQGPLSELAHLYDLTFELQTLNLRDSALLLGLSATLGWCGAMVSLRQQLGKFR
ncbi:MAG: permease-like cell division protein FtsX [Burkholderiaceae bacterium]|nr:permease-like cell division protein FtsX [Sulfuritalea sp.]MCF8176462.1 permease-like cell division protein FtsX [Burkholderiaceae bacterium]MCF8183602.1 permease-like cell division protein FtsX [Polynucleobacter sp.]